MATHQFGVRPVCTEATACKICDGAADLYGVVDMHRPCLTAGVVHPPLSGLPIYYRRCRNCGFLFTDAFDDWTEQEFKTHIYNDGYLAVDPDYVRVRPTQNAGVVAKLWAQHKDAMGVLDFGGGNDVFCKALRASGFREAVTYDPMVAEYASKPDGKFDLVTCFETLEHMPDPVAGIGKMIECLAEPGAVFYSTMTQPAHFDTLGMSWWYVAPRNGHVSIFTRQALTHAWARHGYKNASLDDGTHLAFRELPRHWGLPAI
jgi:2-polyprenyl-6-hydroxyphenyl methylase/3-demethylubiquinone-9 3-methyltransferase